MPPIPTPYDARIQKLKGKINRKQRLGKPGANKLRGRLLKTKTKAWQFGQKNRPDELPWDTQFETEMGGYNRTRDTGMLDIAGRRDAIEKQYGFNPAHAGDPFSVARQLEHDYRTNRGKTLGSYARQGQLYAGSLSNARNIDRRSFEGSLNEASRDYQAALGSLSREEQDLRRLYGYTDPSGKFIPGEKQIEAQAGSLEKAINSPLPPPEAPPKFVAQWKAIQKQRAKKKKKPSNKKKKR